MTMGYFYAKDLRDKEKMKEVPRCPGYYKWWAKKEELTLIFDKFGLSEEMLAYIETENFDDIKRYCIYAGITGRKTLHERFSQHRKCNTEASTLRRSLASLFGENANDEEAADEFIDKLIVQYFSLDDTNPSTETFQAVHEKEKNYLRKNFCILNIQENEHPLAVRTKKLLKDYRKKAKLSVQ